jgi:3-(3-hydroxy-phenyl)propionate hydroxylase
VVVDGRRCRLDDVLGPGAVELSAAGGRVRLRSAGGTAPPLEVLDPGGVLARWLRGGGAATVLVRPDRVVGSARSAP